MPLFIVVRTTVAVWNFLFETEINFTIVNLNLRQYDASMLELMSECWFNGFSGFNYTTSDATSEYHG